VRLPLVLLVLVALLAACSSAAGTDAPAADSSAGATPGGFPVTLPHVFGETTVEQRPERVVTIGWASQDVVAALGTVPVATTDFTWGSVDRYLPWFAERVTELGGELPEIIRYTDNDEVDFEQVLALRPDLILAVHSGINDNEYERLSQIAPTVAYASTPWTSDWQELTRTVGKALGQVDDAERLVAETDEAVAAQRAAHPEFEGVVFTYGWYLSDGATSLDFYVPQDPRVQLVEQLGFTVSPTIAELGTTATGFSTSVSLEQLDTVESQFHIGWADQPGDVDRTLSNGTVSAWDPIADGSYFFMTDQALAWASSQPTVLSIPWSLDELVPAFSEALEG
jgi:iron complex transport system substrate-binding protein